MYVSVVIKKTDASGKPEIGGAWVDSLRLHTLRMCLAELSHGTEISPLPKDLS